MSYLICIVLFSSIFFTIFHFQSPYACKYFDSPLAMHLYHSKAINVEDPQISHYSNLGRIGSTYAAFKIGVDNLSFGIGLGQYGFVYRDYLPAWALDSPEVQQWISNSIDGYWSSVHNLYARLFAETGLFSVLLWLALLVYLILSIAWTPVTDSRLCAGPDKATILTLLVGVALSGMVVDSFRFINFWLVLAMAASWLQLNKRVE